MQKSITVFLTCIALCVQTLSAQVSITSADLPTVGVSKQVATTTNPPINIGTAGTTAQTWNFADVVADNVGEVAFFDPIGSPSAADYPDATIARIAPLGSILGVSVDALGLPINIDNATAFYKIGADGNLYTDGLNVPINIAGLIDLGDQSIPADPDDLYLPTLSLGGSITTSGHYEKEIVVTDPLPISANLNIDVTRTVTADAFGTLNLYGQSYEVLRYNEVLQSHLVADAGILGTIDTNITIQSFRFMSPGQGFPVASVSVEEQESGTVATYIEYIFTGNNPNVGISAPQIEANVSQLLLQTYPNPATDVISCSLSPTLLLPSYPISIYNVLGQLMVQINLAPSASATVIPAQNWASGLYYVQVNDPQTNIVIARHQLMLK